MTTSERMFRDLVGPKRDLSKIGEIITIDGIRRATPEEWAEYVAREERERAELVLEMAELDRLYQPRRPVGFLAWLFGLALLTGCQSWEDYAAEHQCSDSGETREVEQCYQHPIQIGKTTIYHMQCFTVTERKWLCSNPPEEVWR